MDDPLRPARDALLAKRGEKAETVELLQENQDAANIYMLTRNQFITIGQGQPVDLSIPAIKIAMDLHGVRDQAECLRKVLRTFHHFETKRRENESR